MEISWTKVRRAFDRRHIGLMLWVDGLGIGTIVSMFLLFNGWAQCSLGRGLELGAIVAVGAVMKLLSTLGFVLFAHATPVHHYE